MLSDAVKSGKPVGLIELEPSPLAKVLKWAGEIRGRPFRMRDLEKFWNDLRVRGLVGTIERPRRGELDLSPTEIAVAAVRATLDGRAPDAQLRSRGQSRSTGKSAAAEPVTL
jgi:hypothetical protein